MKKLLIPFFVLLIIVVGLGGYLLMQSTQKQTQEDQTTTASVDETLEAKYASTVSLGIPLLELNSSTQMGGASLVENDGKLVVTLDVTDIGDTPQPAHIHLGSCPTPGEVFTTLSPVVNGKSETVLESLQLEDILRELPMAINIHKSADESSVYTACGDIVLPSEE